jgi:hypothetical protein
MRRQFENRGMGARCKHVSSITNIFTSQNVEKKCSGFRTFVTDPDPGESEDIRSYCIGPEPSLTYRKPDYLKKPPKNVSIRIQKYLIFIPFHTIGFLANLEIPSHEMVSYVKVRHD